MDLDLDETIDHVPSESTSAQTEIQDRNRQSDAGGNVEQQQQNVEQQNKHRKKRKRLSADYVEYGTINIFGI